MKGGIVLCSVENTKIKGQPINSLIKAVLLEDRLGEESFTTDHYSIKWVLDNQLDLLFVVVYQKTLKLQYLNDLLNNVKASFTQRYDRTTLKNLSSTYDDFTKVFKNILDDVESSARNAPKPMRGFDKTKDVNKKVSKTTGAVPSAGGSNSNVPAAEAQKSVEQITQKATLKSPAGIRKIGGKRVPGSSRASSSQKTVKPKEPTKFKPMKAKRDWPNRELTAQEKAGLNFSPVEQTAEATRTITNVDDIPINLDEYPELDSSEDSVSEDSSDEKPNKSTPVAKKTSTGFFGRLISTLTDKEITDENISPVLDSFRQHLVTKNVALDIADQLCQSVKTNLLGKKLGTFSRVSSAVRESLESALTRILTPKRNIDILREVQLAQQKGRPYSIVFVGVNGVGKSTSLSKVCAWLLQNKLKVSIAACDTFRSGAVEQLQTHATNLDVYLFHQGYGKDASFICAQALEKAKSDKVDVVLIDTAGRMQHNEPLMKSLSKLVVDNNPDLVFFVGEALVGNDSVDQLQQFNRSLEEYCPVSKTPHLIDGIVLTKFDTVDDKVGAAISMVYTTGSPIVFVGCGQTYADIKSLNVKHIVSVLLSGK
eukprot:TRINITY_DN3135_c0_g3_i4.p1 TRINITY_DN3135_c0_g3~~TRINITY_DN3135_c0_g3_i4.p1  ORF type:complete len:596 (-),score=108.46 TRINITY_DN3135_c0_g3_i4:44-1831(-)